MHLFGVQDIHCNWLVVVLSCTRNLCDYWARTVRASGRVQCLCSTFLEESLEDIGGQSSRPPNPDLGTWIPDVSNMECSLQSQGSMFPPGPRLHSKRPQRRKLKTRPTQGKCGTKSFRGQEFRSEALSNTGVIINPEVH